MLLSQVFTQLSKKSLRKLCYDWSKDCVMIGAQLSSLIFLVGVSLFTPFLLFGCLAVMYNYFDMDFTWISLFRYSTSLIKPPRNKYCSRGQTFFPSYRCWLILFNTVGQQKSSIIKILILKKKEIFAITKLIKIFSTILVFQ